MISAANLNIYGLLSEASYADFSKTNYPLGGTALSDLLQGKETGPGGEPWPKSLATEFAKHWRVVSHQPNTDSGFSATVFEKLNDSGQPSGQYVFATRGTEPIATYMADIAADAGDLVANGLAWEQIIDMHNYWKRISTPAGQTYQVASAVKISDETAKALLLAGSNNLIVEAGQAWIINFENRTSNCQSPIASVDVVGHSLGGHLATAFSRLFANQTGDVLSVNGAGYSSLGVLTGNTERVFAALGGASGFDASKILNIYGDRGLNFTTQDFWAGLSQPGTHKPIYIEDALGHTLGHGSDQMVDSLAIYDLFIRLDSSIANLGALEALARIRPFVDAASNQAANTFESAVDGLRRLLGLPELTKTKVDDRETFYKALIELETSDAFKALAGQKSRGQVLFSNISIVELVCGHDSVNERGFVGGTSTSQSARSRRGRRSYSR